MTVGEIEEAILKLAPDELARFRVWFARFETGMPAPAAPQETTATKLGGIAGRMFADVRKRMREP